MPAGMRMQGVLAKYGSGTSHVAFISGPPFHSRHVVLVGGLTDGLLFTSYVPALAEHLQQAGWSVVQAQLTSSYQGFGVASITEDAQELRQVVEWLAEEESSQAVVLMGHSTGCQDIARFMQLMRGQAPTQGGKAARNIWGAGAGEGGAPWSGLPVVGTILQAPVSDREWLGMHSELAPIVERARAMKAQGQEQEIVARLALLGGVPITAQRLCDLHDEGGDDDMFSQDLSDSLLEACLGPTGTVPTFILASGADEAVPDPATIPAQAERIRRAVSKGGCEAKLSVVAEAPHNLRGHEDECARLVMDFVQSLGLPA